MRHLISAAALASVLVLASTSTTASAAIIDSVNGSSSPAFFTWGSNDMGWYYTPSSSYVLSSIQTKIATTPGTITVAIYSDRPAIGGTLLASGTYTQVVSQFGGPTFSSGVSLTSGTSYFVAFQGISATGINCTQQSGATSLGYPWYSSSSVGTFDIQSATNFRPIIQFVSVPEPSVLGPILLIGTGLIRRKPRNAGE